MFMMQKWGFYLYAALFALNQVVINGRPRPYLVKASLDLARRLGAPPEGSRIVDQLMMMSRGAR